MASQGWRCHNDKPVTVTILDCTAVQKKENDPESIVRFYNCEVCTVCTPVYLGRIPRVY